MMKVLGVSRISANGGKYRVRIEGQDDFVLYRGDLSRYHIRQDAEISEEVFARLQETLIKRAKIKALKLLEMSDRSEAGLKNRLASAGYPPCAVEAAAEYVKSYGYIDDGRFASYLVSSRKGQKSRAELQAFLRTKGLQNEQIEQALEAEYTAEDAVAAIQRLAEKRHYDPQKATVQEKQRLYAYLARKGFRYDDIRQVIQVSDGDA